MHPIKSAQMGSSSPSCSLYDCPPKRAPPASPEKNSASSRSRDPFHLVQKRERDPVQNSSKYPRVDDARRRDARLTMMAGDGAKRESGEVEFETARAAREGKGGRADRGRSTVRCKRTRVQDQLLSLATALSGLPSSRGESKRAAVARGPNQSLAWARAEQRDPY